MAATPVEVLVGVDGQTGLTLTLFSLGSDTPANGAGDPLTEQTNRHGTYRAIIDEALSGVFEAYVLDADGDVFFYGFLYLQDDTQVWTVADDLASARAAVTNGTGARSVSITVSDGAVAVEGALVRLSKGVATYLQTTNGAGQCAFNVDDGTWAVAITLVGYTFAGASLVVDGDEVAAYTMTPPSVSPAAAPGLTTGFVTCLGIDGLAEAGVTIQAQLTAGTGVSGLAFDSGVVTMTSDAQGLAQHTGFVRGASYRFKRGRGNWTDAYVAPDAATWSLANILGTP
jgi:hypothetical protein